MRWYPLCLALVLCFASRASAEKPFEVTSEHEKANVKEGRRSQVFFELSAGEAMVLEAEGPTLLTFDLCQLRKGRRGSPAQGTLSVLRDGTHRTQAEFDISKARGRRTRIQGGRFATPSVQHMLEVPEGAHEYRVSVDAEPDATLAIHVAVAKQKRAKLLFPPEEPLPGMAEAVAAAETEPAKEQTEDESKEDSADTDNEARGAEKRAELVGVVAGGEERIEKLRQSTAAEKEDGDDSTDNERANDEPKPVEVQASDPAVASATRALAGAMIAGYERLGRPMTFHRVAVPYFEEVGDGVKEHHLGRLISELLSVELSQQESLVVVERERLSQVMREHRLKGLGIVDENTAADFGRVLGAQSLISGTVTEAGPNYVVTVRQVDVESGQVLASGQVPVEKAGLIALSSEAVVKRSKMGALFRSALIPGWGQLYNDNAAKSALFAGAGLATLGGGLAFYVASLSPRDKYLDNSPDTVDQREVANDRIRMANILLIGYAAVWGLNVLDAYLSGKNYTEVEVPVSGEGVAVHF